MAADNLSTVSNFIQDRIAEDLKKNKNEGSVVTRFPPEPNGYLHIGHAKSIFLNFGLAKKFNGRCHLRFDDTNPEKEETEYTESIKKDVLWLGFDWGGHLYYASDYFEKLFDYAVQLIKQEKAYVCSLNADEIREYRGTLKEPGRNSPYRDRPIDENLDLFNRMRAGEFNEGEHVLRAKIDMSSGNLSLRDPAIYRIRKVHHHRTGDKWCIYPMYDFTHCLSDSIEGITHSICTLEFENNRPLYDWVLDTLNVKCHPQQIEFARLNLTYTVLSKRKLIELVEDGYVSGWDDPRLMTISGLRRRGYTSASIKDFCERIGVAKRDSTVDVALLEHCLREDLNKTAPRAMAVLDPVKVVITNYPEGKTEERDAKINPEESELGTRKMPFSRTIYIEKDDFREDPPKKYFRLAPGKEVRLKYAYYVKCENIVKDDNGDIIEIHCTYDPETRGGWSEDGRKVKGTIHWVSAEHAKKAEVRLFEHLFTEEVPENSRDDKDYKSYINPESKKVLHSCLVEPELENAVMGKGYQFERLGYFCLDSADSSEEKPVFNRIASLRDSWAKIEKARKKG